MFPDGNKYWGSRIYKWGEMGWKWGGFQMFVVLSLSHQISLGEMMVQRMWWWWKQASSALFLSHQAHFPASTYHSELVGRGAVLEQDVDDVRVPLLRRLVQRRVPVLQAQGGRESTLRWAQHTHTEQGSTPRRSWGTHLRFGVDFCRMLQKEVDDFYVSVVAANVQRSVSHLEWTSAVSKWGYPTRALI